MRSTTTKPIARTTDPATSHAAAASVNDVTLTQYAILVLLRDQDMTDQELVEAYHAAWYIDPVTVPRASDSGIRSRRAELVARGLVVDTGNRTRTASGRQAILWGTP